MGRATATLMLAAALLLCVRSARAARFHGGALQHALALDAGAPPALRSVTDVGPAVENATALALSRAEGILERYSNALRIASIPGGLLVTFVGTFLLAPVLFVAGFLSAGGVAFVSVKALFGAETPAAARCSIGAMVVVGLLAAVLSVRLMGVGMFAVGAMLGVAAASALKPGVLARVYPANENVGFYAGAVVLGLLLGAVAMRFQRQMVIIATAYGGAFAFFSGIGYFAGHFPSEADLAKAQKGLFTTWLIVYFVFTLLLGTAGAFAQFRLAGKRPLVVNGRVEGADGGGPWWRRKRDEQHFGEVQNLPQNELGERGKSRVQTELSGVVVERGTLVSAQGSTTREARFDNSVSESGVNQVAGMRERDYADRSPDKGSNKTGFNMSKSLSPKTSDAKFEVTNSSSSLGLA